MTILALMTTFRKLGGNNSNMKLDPQLTMDLYFQIDSSSIEVNVLQEVVKEKINGAI